MFASISDNYMFYETSGVDCSQDIIMGRPYGGLAILYKRSIADKVKMVKTSIIDGYVYYKYITRAVYQY